MSRGFALKEGYAFNPLRSYPPNYKCWCGSNRKSKLCCLPSTPRAVKTEVALDLRRFLDAVDQMKDGSPVLAIPKDKIFSWRFWRVGVPAVGAALKAKSFRHKPVFKAEEKWIKIAGPFYWMASNKPDIEPVR